MTTKAQHGGPRVNSGRRTRYPNKEPKILSLLLTAAGRRKLRAIQRREKASMADVVEHLIREFGDQLRMPPLPNGTEA
jgi:hypothetical protein